MKKQSKGKMVQLELLDRFYPVLTFSLQANAAPGLHACNNCHSQEEKKSFL